jgi:hypothetical protein
MSADSSETHTRLGWRSVTLTRLIYAPSGFETTLVKTSSSTATWNEVCSGFLCSGIPRFAHPTRAELSNEVTPESVIAKYAESLEGYALDVVKGDFSAFPTLIYVLHHVDRKFPGRPVRRLLGLYSTYDLTTAAIDDRLRKNGFAERADGFEIWRVQVNGFGFWFAGIPLDDPRDDNG